MDEFEIRKKEILRLLGYGRNKADEYIERIIYDCYNELSKTSDSKIVIRRYPIEQFDIDTVVIAGIRLYSRKLARNLSGCKEVLLFGATLGTMTDRLIEKYQKTQVSKALIMDAVANESIEYYCNSCQNNIARELARDNLFLRPRYSPGYGDLSIVYQKEILRLIDAQRTIGVILSEGDVMMPLKSVTAILGISETNTSCSIEGCETCAKKNCAYKRDI